MDKKQHDQEKRQGKHKLAYCVSIPNMLTSPQLFVPQHLLVFAAGDIMWKNQSEVSLHIHQDNYNTHTYALNFT